MTEDITVVLFVVVILIISGIILAVLPQKLHRFRRELRYINMEISRSSGRERVYWKNQKRLLWRSLLPFFGK